MRCPLIYRAARWWPQSMVASECTSSRWLGAVPSITVGACVLFLSVFQDCQPEVKELFKGSCFSGVFGGHVSPLSHHRCKVGTTHQTPDWFPFLCVQSPPSTSPFLGHFYHGGT